MNHFWKHRWLEALRSGKYQQTHGCLRDNQGFDCLGVLCDISNTGKWVQLTGESYVYSYRIDDTEWCDYLPEAVQGLTGLPRRPRIGNFFLDNLIDHGLSFSEIASLIQKHY